MGLFNTGTTGTIMVTANWSASKLEVRPSARDLWRPKDLGVFRNELSMKMALHNAELVKSGP